MIGRWEESWKAFLEEYVISLLARGFMIPEERKKTKQNLGNNDKERIRYWDKNVDLVRKREQWIVGQAPNVHLRSELGGFSKGAGPLMHCVYLESPEHIYPYCFSPEVKLSGAFVCITSFPSKFLYSFPMSCIIYYFISFT